MKKLLILGAGTAGTIMANRLYPVLDKTEWEITIVDQYDVHYYQPGFLFIPFGIYSRGDVIKSKRDYLPPGINLKMSAIEVIEPKKNRVKLQNGEILSYDYLIVATGTKIHPEETEGMLDGGWHKNIFDFLLIVGNDFVRRAIHSFNAEIRNQLDVFLFQKITEKLRSLGLGEGPR